MKILVVCQYYYPENFRITDICESLIEKGHSVTILTGLPNYPEGVVSKKYKFFKNRNEKINGVNVLRCFEIGRRKGSFFLALNYISFMLSSAFKALTLKSDYNVVFCYQLSPVLMALPAIVYKYKNHKKFLLYCLDIWPESLKLIVKNENKIIFRLVKKFSTYIYNKCDKICVTSKPFINYLNKVDKVDISKIEYLPQHADNKYLSMNLQTENNEFINFLFAGNIGIAQNLDCLINAISYIDNKDNIKIHIVGDGSYIQQCINLVNIKELGAYFIFHGRKPADEMVNYYKMADACLLTLNDENYTGQTLPGKVQEYMATGKYIIGAINGVANELIKEVGCGECVPSGESQKLAAAIVYFINNKQECVSRGQLGREYFKNNFVLSKYIDKLECYLNNLI